MTKLLSLRDKLRPIYCMTSEIKLLIFHKDNGETYLPDDFLLLADRTLVEIFGDDDGRTVSCLIVRFSTSSER